MFQICWGCTYRTRTQQDQEMNQPYPDEWLTQPWGLARRLLIEAWQAGALGGILVGRVPPVSWPPPVPWPNQQGESIELERLGEGSYGQVGKLKLRYQVWVRIISTNTFAEPPGSIPQCPCTLRGFLRS